MGSFRYWGGFHGDFETKLRERGFTVFSVSIGALSSNWDRACEVYAQIKGGRVDYGVNHSSIHGHRRYGRTFPGFIPEWGDVVDGKLQKVHLVGQSMGGQTIRFLTQMLQHGTSGSPSEEDPTSHPLFRGGKDWVHSITTISTPHRGSTLYSLFEDSAVFLQHVAVSTAGLIGVAGNSANDVYNFGMEQWDLSPRTEDESVTVYMNRILASNMFEDGWRDMCSYAVSLEGAQVESSWARTLPGIYYYSIVGTDTFKTTNLRSETIELPNVLSMMAPLQPFATYMGSRVTIDLGYSEDWLPNDGLVNEPSQISDGYGTVFNFTDSSVSGAWVHFPTYRNMDHFAILGFHPSKDVYPIYDARCALLYDLPSHEEGSAVDGKRLASQGLVDAISSARETLNEGDGSYSKCQGATFSLLITLCWYVFEEW